MELLLKHTQSGVCGILLMLESVTCTCSLGFWKVWSVTEKQWEDLSTPFYFWKDFLPSLVWLFLRCTCKTSVTFGHGLNSLTVEPQIKGQPLCKGHSSKYHSHRNTFWTSEKRTTSLQRTTWLPPKCPLFGRSTILWYDKWFDWQVLHDGARLSVIDSLFLRIRFRWFLSQRWDRVRCLHNLVYPEDPPQ